MKVIVDQFMKQCNCRSVGECGHNSTAEFQALDKLVDEFAIAMKEKLRAKALHGRSGWDRDDWADQCRTALVKHIAKGDPVDVANFAAFLWNMGKPTTDRSNGDE